MFAQLAIGSALLSGSLAARFAPTPSWTSDATITPGPRIELLKKQNNARDLGWLLFSGNWEFESCQEGGTYYETASQWGCCATGDNGCAATDLPIGCVDGSLIYPKTGTDISEREATYACTSVYTAAEDSTLTVCNTMLVFESDGDNSPLTNVVCGTASDRWSYYREKPAAAMTSTTDSSSSGPSSQRTTSSGSTPTSEPSSTLSPSINPPIPEDKPKSKAWIAGAVVGPILGLALLGLIAWLLIRRRKKKTQYQPAATAESPSAPPAAYPQQAYPPGPESPPQFYPPPMQQNTGAVPFGVATHDSWAPGQSAYGSQQQQWQGQDNLHINQAPMIGGHPGYGTPSPSMSPQPGYAQPTQYDTGTYKHEVQPAQPLNELEGSAAHTQPMSELPGAPARTQ